MPILLHPTVISLCIVLTLPQMGHADGSFLYFVPSSPFASISSLFMFFEPEGTEHTHTHSAALIKTIITPEELCFFISVCTVYLWCLTHDVASLVVLHHVFTVKHFVTHLTGVQLLPVFLLMFG